MSVIHNFQEQLAFSEAQADLPIWETIYKQAFPTFANMTDIRKDAWGQRSGIDRIVVLECGKTLAIDEKIRRKTWPDFALEYWSNKERKIPGWVAKDLTCDYIAYAFLSSRKCYLLPFQQLRKAWRENYRDWTSNYKNIEALNPNYTTVCVCVPIPEVMKAISESLVIAW